MDAGTTGSVLCGCGTGDSSNWVGSDCGHLSSGTFLWHLAVAREITARGNNNNNSAEKAGIHAGCVRHQASGSSVTNLYYPLYKLNIAGGWAAARGVKKRCYVLKELVLLCMREELLLTALVCRNMPHRAALVSMRHIRNTCITLTLWLQYEYQSRSGPLRTAALEEGAQLLI